MKYYLSFVLSFLILSTLQAQDTQNPCLKGSSFHGVIIGSSTAAGTGPTNRDSAWVNRFRTYVKSINPTNEVTNLAVGGTTTYQIMPDSFVAPSNRPATNSTKNVSEAIRLGADFIVVNMPSNDGSRGYGASEQMSNFRRIVNYADSFDVPVWVCTTQPKTTSNQGQISIQTAVRDSILNAFGSRAIDFWTTIAKNDTIDTKYNSGDNTHLNNAAHGVLFNRVKDKNILSALFDTLPRPDVGIVNIVNATPTECGRDSNLFLVVYCNYGIPTSTATQQINELFITSTPPGHVRLDNNIPAGLKTCVLDTAEVLFNTSILGDYRLNSSAQNAQDTVRGNNLKTLIFSSLGEPNLMVTSDTNCSGKSFTLSANSDGKDKISWLDRFGRVLDSGNTHVTGPLSNSEVFFVHATRGNLFYSGDISTTMTSNRDWNGAMFDIVAHEDMVIDSVWSRINTTGNQSITAYFKKGTHQGSENTATDWTLWDTDFIDVANSGDLVAADFGSKSLIKGDTLGVYIYLTASGGQLKYNAESAARIRTDSVVSIITGTGISHAFQNLYYPRDWNGKISYHYGNRPNGACRTVGRGLAVVEDISVDLGNDTTLLENDFLVLSAPANWVSYLWSDGSTNSFLVVDTSNYPVGVHNIWVEGDNQFKCSARDTIRIEMKELIIDDETGIPTNINNQRILLFPNPNNGQFSIHSTETIQQLEILNMAGQIIFSKGINSTSIETKALLSKGVYLARIVLENEIIQKQIVIE